MKKIVVFGAGYVGLSLSLLLAQKNKVLIFDIDEKKVKKLITENLQSKMIFLMIF